MKTHQCTQCENKTLQKDRICVSCKLGLTRMYTELVDLMKKDKKWNMHTRKT